MRHINPNVGLSSYFHTAWAITRLMQCSEQPLLNELVGRGEQRRRHIEAECLGGHEIDNKLVLGQHLNRQVGRLVPRRMRST
jgi:hypothetical protein